jgi:hypothetical protein
MLVIVQVVGALLVLVPFAAQQFGKLNSGASAYLWPNAVGSAALAVLAAINRQWGFLLLEAVWAAVALRTIICGPTNASLNDPRGRLPIVNRQPQRSAQQRGQRAAARLPAPADHTRLLGH